MKPKRSVVELAHLVRERNASEIVADIEENPHLLRETDGAGVPLVHILALTNQLSFVKVHLDLSVLETIWGPGWTVAHTSAQSRELQPLADLLEKFEHLLVWSAENGDTPVHIAAKRCNLDQIANLLTDPSRLAVQNNILDTPVHIAAANNCLFQIRDCLIPGLLAQRDLTGVTALDIAMKYHCANLIDEEVKRQTRILLGVETRTVDDVV